MGLVIITIGALFLATVLVWYVGWTYANRIDANERREAEAKVDARKEADMLDSLLSQPGRELLCLGCGMQFRGPIPETGCPKCHIRSTVVPVAYTDADATATISLQEVNGMGGSRDHETL